MKKQFFKLFLFFLSGFITVQQAQAQCPTVDSSIGTSPVFGSGIEVCYQSGGTSADITFTFLNDGSDYEGFLLFDLANGSFLIQGLHPVVYVHTPGSNVWVVQNVPDQFLGKNGRYVFAKVGCGTIGGFGIDLDPSKELLITDSNVTITNNTRCLAPYNGAITVLPTGGYGTYTYSWTGPNAFTATTASIASLEPGTYNVTVTDGHRCSYSKSIVVANNATNPIVSISGLNSPYCTNSPTVLLTGSAAPGGTFSGPGITDLGNGTANFNPATAGVGGNIIYTYTDLLACTGSTTVPVVVNPVPATPIATNDGPGCEGGTVTLSTAAVAGATYSWTGPNGFVSNLQSPSISNIAAVNAGIYSVTVTVSGCPSLAGTTTVVVNPLPATPAASNDGPVCVSGTLTLSTPAVGGATYSWTGPNGFTSNAQNPVISNITVAGAGVYSVTINNGTCASLPGTTTVVVNPIPATPTATNTGPVCVGGNITLSTPVVAGAIYSWTGPNGFVSNLQSPVIINATAANAGVYSVSISLLGCPSLPGTTTVVVNPIPATPIPTNDGPVCVGGTVTLSTPAVAGATYSWTGPNGFSSNLQSPAIINITAANAGLYSLTITVSGCPSVAGTTTLVVDPLPATPTASNDGPVCVGGTLTLSTPLVGGATYSWTGPNGFSSNLQNPVITNITAAGAGVYSATINNGTCVSLPGTTTVVVNPLPATPTATNTGPVCVGGNITLSTPDVPGAIYSWTGPNGFVSNLREPLLSGVTVANAGVYSVTVTLLGCPSLAGTTTVVVNPIPATPVATNSGPACVGGTVTLSTPAVAGATYSWTGPNGFSSNLQSPAIINITAANAGLYSVTVTVSGCPSLAGTTTVVVNPLPATPPASNDGPVCVGGTLTLSTPAVGGAIYSWTGPNGFTSNAQNPVISNITVAGAGVYSVTINNGTCVSLPGTTTVLVNPIPATPTATNTGPVCVGGSITLSTPDVPGAIYSWTGPNGFVSNLREPLLSGVTVANAGVYSVTVTLLGCPSLPGTTTVVVNPIPATPIPTNDGPVCVGGTVNLSTAAVTGATYSWTGPSGFSSNLQNPVITNITAANAGLYSLTITVSGCPSVAGTTTVVVNPLPATPAASNDGPVCAGGTLTLSTPLVAGATYSWTGPNGFVSNVQNPVIIGITALGAGVYSVTINNGTCVSLPGTTAVVVNPIPVTPIANNDGPVCLGGNVTLSTAAIPGATYNWTGPNGFVSNLQSPIINNVTAANAGLYSVTISLLGCPSLPGSTTVVVNPLPATPTAINDGPVCEGGTINLSTAAVAGATYSWTGPNGFSSNLQSPVISNITAADAGVYSLSINDGICPSLPGTTSVAINPKPAAITISGDNNPVCQAIGEVYTVVGGQPGSTYAWSIPLGATIVGPSTSPSITVTFGLNSGNITVIEQTVSGCFGDLATLPVILQACPFTADFVSDVNIQCVNGTVVFTDASAAPIGTTYSWDFGVGASTATANTSGPHSVTYSSGGVKSVTLSITNGAQTDQITKTITINELPTALLSGNDIICPGGSTVLTVALTGIAPWSFTYNDGNSDITQVINSSPYSLNVSPANTTTYSAVSVSDALCSGTATGTATIDVTPAKQVTISLDSITGVPGSQVKVPLRLIDFQDILSIQFTVTWNPALLSYNGILDNILSSATFGQAAVAAGSLTYSWNALADTTFADNTAIFAISFDVANTVCSDAPVTVNSSVTPIEVADENLCIANVVVENGNLEIQATASIVSNLGNTICFGDQVLFTGLPGGLPQYDFYLNGALAQSGANSVLLTSALVDGDSMNVVVNDAQGCTLPAQGIVMNVRQLVLIPTVTDISACGAFDGAIALAVSGGSGNYTFAWTGPSITNPLLQNQANLARGFYSVSVTDNTSGCIEKLDIELKEPVSFTLAATKSDVTSTGGNDGSINLTITGGTGSFSVTWTGPNGFTSTNQNISGLFAGTYTATVRDNGDGCTDGIAVEILQPLNALILNATKTDVTTCGAMNGTINLIINGGSGSYLISWVGPNSFTSNSQNLSGLTGGLYIATVVDQVTTLTAQWTVQVNEPQIFDASTVVSDITYCSGADGKINLTVINGSGTFTYAWKDLSGLGFTASTKDISNLAIGLYRVVISDTGTGCVDSLEARVGRPAICDQPCGLYVESTTNNTSCPDTDDGVAVINIISGGSGPGNYYVSLDTGKTFVPFLGQDITAIIDRGQGSYLYIVKDTVTSCRDTTIANVGVSTNLMANISVDDTGCLGNDGTITFNVSGGVVPFEVVLIDSLGNATLKSGNGFFQFMNLTPGSYFYRIREQSGCTIIASDSIEVQLDCTSGCTSLTASARNFKDATCASDPNGQAIIDVKGGSSPYEYTVDGVNWIPFISGNVINKLPPNGNYNITVRQDSANASCRVDVGVQIFGPAPLVQVSPNITTTKASCNQNDGAVKVGKITGGVTPYNYKIDGSFISFPVDSIVTGLTAGNHILSVVDAGGCTEDFAFTVDSPGAIIADATEVPVSCTSIFLKAGIRVQVDLAATTLPGPYEAYISTTSDPNNGIIYQIPDNGLRTILNLEKDFYNVVVRSSLNTGCTYSETLSVFSGAYPLSFDIIEYDTIVSCLGSSASITIGNVKGDPNAPFIVQLINEQNIVLNTYSLTIYELEGGFTIDENNSENLEAGKYYIKIIQNQAECPDVQAVSDLVTINEPLGVLGFEVLEDMVSLSDRPTGYILGEIAPSGGTPYEVLIQLKEPLFEMNIADIIDFNNRRSWTVVDNASSNQNLFVARFDSLYAGTYEIWVRDSYGCEFTIEHTIGYDATVFVPNIFTPNADGYNDDFYIRNLPDAGTQVVITNRNGMTVFKSDNYTYDSLWDGGNEADGIYFYRITMPNGDSFKGWVEKWSEVKP